MRQCPPAVESHLILLVLPELQALSCWARLQKSDVSPHLCFPPFATSLSYSWEVQQLFKKKPKTEDPTVLLRAKPSTWELPVLQPAPQPPPAPEAPSGQDLSGRHPPLARENPSTWWLPQGPPSALKRSKNIGGPEVFFPKYLSKLRPRLEAKCWVFSQTNLPIKYQFYLLVL